MPMKSIQVKKVRHYLDNIFKCVLGHNYEVGTWYNYNGASECPNGYQPVNSLSRCNEARNELSISGWNGVKTKNHRERLPYCWVGSGGRANYNPRGDSGWNPPVPTSKLICEVVGWYD